MMMERLATQGAARLGTDETYNILYVFTHLSLTHCLFKDIRTPAHQEAV
jgi:hypothetical protein